MPNGLSPYLVETNGPRGFRSPEERGVWVAGRGFTIFHCHYYYYHKSRENK